MVLNFVPLVYRDFIIVIFGIISSYLMIREIKYNKNKHFKPFLIALVIYLVYPFIRVFALLFMNEFLHKIGYIFFVVGMIVLVRGLNNITNEQPNIVKLLSIAVVGSMAAAFAWLPGTSTINYMFGFPYFNYSGLWMIFGLAFEALLMLYIIEFFARASRNAPQNLKKQTFTIAVVISVYIGINILISFLPELLIGLIPDVIIWILALIGEISIATVPFVFLLILLFNPEIMFILPFTAFRLTVILLKGGYSIFNYIWTESRSLVVDDLLAGLFSALRAMSEKVLQVGLIEEIKFEKGILLFSKGEHIMVGLLSSKSSRYLRENLELFTRDFEMIFEKELQAKSISENMFKSATELVEKYYRNIPKRI